jgi:hypothetical protein
LTPPSEHHFLGPRTCSDCVTHFCIFKPVNEGGVNFNCEDTCEHRRSEPSTQKTSAACITIHITFLLNSGSKSNALGVVGQESTSCSRREWNHGPFECYRRPQWRFSWSIRRLGRMQQRKNGHELWSEDMRSYWNTAELPMQKREIVLKDRWHQLADSGHLSPGGKRSNMTWQTSVEWFKYI